MVDLNFMPSTSLTVSHNSLDLGRNTAAGLWDSLCNNIDCLISQASMSIDQVGICISKLAIVPILF